MLENQDKPFLYQMNINRRKFPEICDHLDKMKDHPNGLAWYLRQLVEKDIEARKKKGN